MHIRYIRAIEPTLCRSTLLQPNAPPGDRKDTETLVSCGDVQLLYKWFQNGYMTGWILNRSNSSQDPFCYALKYCRSLRHSYPRRLGSHTQSYSTCILMNFSTSSRRQSRKLTRTRTIKRAMILQPNNGDVELVSPDYSSSLRLRRRTLEHGCPSRHHYRSLQRYLGIRYRWKHMSKEIVEAKRSPRGSHGRRQCYES